YLELTDPTARHWLPTDIYVNQDGSVDFKSYINNIHPEGHADMYTSISKIISKAIPLLEQALTDWEHPRDLRIPYNFEYCLKAPIEHPANLGGKFGMESEEYDNREYCQAVDEWIDTIIDITPDPEEFVEPERPLVPYSLRNKNLQVVVEISKGMTSLSDTASENIIATVEYYYDSKGEKPLTIEFQEAIKTDLDSIGSSCDMLTYNTLYGFRTNDKGDMHVQSAGDINVKQGRLICYPNVYDQGNGFHRCSDLKRMTMYFVDPSVRIVSTAIVPPQQKDWWVKTVSSVPSRVSMLPLEVQDMIFNHVDIPMSFEKACEVSKKTSKPCYHIENSRVFNCYVHVGDKSIYDPYIIQPTLSAHGL
ncbi:hypothetical protein H4R99_007100, partial [Coemansia sp. RSA 1722]